MYENFDDFLNAVNTTPLEEPLLEAGIYNMQIKSVRKVVSKGREGGFNYVVISAAIDYPTAQDVFEYLPIPLPTDAQKSSAFMLRKIAQFLAALGAKADVLRNITEDGGDDALVGMTYAAEVGLQPERNDEVTGKKYQAKNCIEKYVFNK